MKGRCKQPIGVWCLKKSVALYLGCVQALLPSNWPCRLETAHPNHMTWPFFFFFYSLKQLFYLFEGCLDCWRLLFGLGHVPLHALHLSHEPFVQSERKKKKREKGFKKIRIFLHRRATVLSLSHGLVSQMQTPSWSERYYACIASLMNEFHPRHHQ